MSMMHVIVIKIHYVAEILIGLPRILTPVLKECRVVRAYCIDLNQDNHVFGS